MSFIWSPPIYCKCKEPSLYRVVEIPQHDFAYTEVRCHCCSLAMRKKEFLEDIRLRAERAHQEVITDAMSLPGQRCYT